MNDPTLVRDLEALIEPTTCGDPQSPVALDLQRALELGQALTPAGASVSHQTAAVRLEQLTIPCSHNRNVRTNPQHLLSSRPAAPRRWRRAAPRPSAPSATAGSP